MKKKVSQSVRNGVAQGFWKEKKIALTKDREDDQNHREISILRGKKHYRDYMAGKNEYSPGRRGT
jgi:hypothetical protein